MIIYSYWSSTRGESLCPQPSSSGPETPPAARIARAFAAEGLTACVNRRTRNADQLEALARSIRDGGHQARAFPGDAREEDA